MATANGYQANSLAHQACQHIEAYKKYMGEKT
jgi:hypothetical protein